LGIYPTVSLSAARAKREEIKKMIAEGVDPSEERKAKKNELKQQQEKSQNTLYNIAQKWLDSYKDQVSGNYHTKIGRMLDLHVFPKYKLKNGQTLYLKDTPIEDVTRLEIIDLLEAIKDKGVTDTPRRVAMLLNKIFKYAVTHEYAPHNIMADIELMVVLGKHTKKHYPTFTKTKEIRGLLKSIDGYDGDYFTKMALKVLPYVFVRSYNIRHMEWQEIDFKAQEWIIPAHKMKTKTEFILPLPHQVMELLEEVRENSLSTKYVFPSFRSDGKPLSDNTLISALRRMGYSKEEFVPHSFRAMFSTIAYEYANIKGGHGYTGEVIEACLAHKEPNKIKEAYNRSNYKEPMRGLMQWYADYLEGVKNGN
jgi:integrase